MNVIRQIQTKRSLCFAAICSLFFFFLNILSAFGDSSPADVIKVGIYDNPPKVFMDEHQRPRGIFPGVIQTIAYQENWNITFVPVTFKAGLKGLLEGSIDIMQDVAWSPERAQLYGFTTETVMVSWGRIFKKKGLDINTLIDLKGKRIAIMDGGIYSEGPDGLKSLMSKFELDAQFIPVHGYKQVLTLVDQGKADAGVVNRLYGKRNKHVFDIESTPILISPISIRLAFSKTNPVTPQLIQVIDSHLAEMKMNENSIYYQLIDEYIRSPRKTVPQTIKRLLGGLLFLSVFFAILWMMSSWQVRKKTAQLRKRDRELAASEKKFRTIFENLQDVYFDSSLSGKFNLISPSAEAVLGFSLKELIHQPVDKIYHNINDRTPMIELLLKNGCIRDYELLCKKKDQSLCWISLNADLYYDASGTPSGITGVVRDITQKKKTQEELVKREERFREMARLLPCGIVETDLDLMITYANQTGLNMFGYTRADLEKGLNVRDILHENDHKTAFNRLAILQKNSAVQALPAPAVEYRMKTKDGGLLNVLWNIRPMVENGKTIGYRGSLSDLTEIKQLQEDVLRTQKLKSTGMLAGGIAHDFNNILLGLFGNISLAKSELVKSDTAYALLEDAETSMSRAKDLTTQLLTFAQGGDPVKSAVTIEQTIRETANFNLTGSNIKVVIEHPEELWHVNADKGQISQVISNLVINARQAMADGGLLKIKMENAALSENEYASMELDKYVKISIKDQGVGISEKNLEKIFDPYFTTKQEGNGLGLAIVHSIILKHNGYIYVNSEPGRGTTFVIYLPAIETDSYHTERSQQDGGQHADARPLDILLMDDDRLVLTVTTRMLEKLGHRVVTCTNGLKAINAYKKALDEKKPFDLVIMDLTIPGGMGGQKAIQQVLEMDPAATVVVASGYSTDPVLAGFRKYGFKAVIKKPYTLEKIRQTIDSAVSF